MEADEGTPYLLAGDERGAHCCQEEEPEVEVDVEVGGAEVDEEEEDEDPVLPTVTWSAFFLRFSSSCACCPIEDPAWKRV